GQLEKSSPPLATLIRASSGCQQISSCARRPPPDQDLTRLRQLGVTVRVGGPSSKAHGSAVCPAVPAAVCRRSSAAVREFAPSSRRTGYPRFAAGGGLARKSAWFGSGAARERCWSHSNALSAVFLRPHFDAYSSRLRRSVNKRLSTGQFRE